MNRGDAVMLSPTLWQILLNLYADMALTEEAVRERLSVYLRRYKTRQQLRYLTPEQLEDIGLTADQAKQEMNTPFWR